MRLSARQWKCIGSLGGDFWNWCIEQRSHWNSKVATSNFKPAEIIKQLNLLRPIYRKTTNYGHFGRVDDLDAITWERTDKAEALRAAVK